MARVLITGANGFIGRHLIPTCLSAGWRVRAAARQIPLDTQSSAEWRRVGDLAQLFDWSDMLSDVDCVVHLAGYAHRRRNIGPSAASLCEAVNYRATRMLAEAAVQAGVRRFIFISTIGVLGNATEGRPLQDDDDPCPTTFYARSKLAAEQALWEIGRQSTMQIVIIRPPLIYGRGAPGNFSRLVRLVQLGLPLPLAGIQNRRSLLFVENLVEAILLCIQHPLAAGETFTLSDGEPVSTPELIREIANAMQVPVRLWAAPGFLLRLVSSIAGYREEMRQLTASLVVDDRKIRTRLGWCPQVTFTEGIKRSLCY